MLTTRGAVEVLGRRRGEWLARVKMVGRLPMLAEGWIKGRAPRGKVLANVHDDGDHRDRPRHAGDDVLRQSSVRQPGRSAPNCASSQSSTLRAGIETCTPTGARPAGAAGLRAWPPTAGRRRRPSARTRTVPQGPGRANPAGSHG